MQELLLTIGIELEKLPSNEGIAERREYASSDENAAEEYPQSTKIITTKMMDQREHTGE